MEYRLMSEDGSRELASWTEADGIPQLWYLAVERGCIVQARTASLGAMGLATHVPCTGYHFHNHQNGTGQHAGWHEHFADSDHVSDLHTHPHPGTAQTAPLNITGSPSAASVVPQAQPPGASAANDDNAYDPTSV
jgi:hypothetical protein